MVGGREGDIVMSYFRLDRDLDMVFIVRDFFRKDLLGESKGEKVREKS